MWPKRGNHVPKKYTYIKIQQRYFCQGKRELAGSKICSFLNEFLRTLPNVSSSTLSDFQSILEFKRNFRRSGPYVYLSMVLYGFCSLLFNFMWNGSRANFVFSTPRSAETRLWAIFTLYTRILANFLGGPVYTLICLWFYMGLLFTLFCGIANLTWNRISRNSEIEWKKYFIWWIVCVAEW